MSRPWPCPCSQVIEPMGRSVSMPLSRAVFDAAAVDLLMELAGDLAFGLNALRLKAEHARAEAALRASEGYFRSLIENASDIITVLDDRAIIRFESPAVERVLGFAPEALIGKNVLELVHPEDVSAILDVFTRTPRIAGASAIVEVRFQHRDGAWRTLEATGRAVVDTQGQLAVVINSRDVTERKQAEWG